MSDLERPILKSDFDNMPQETYAGLGYATHRFADFIPVADDKDQYALRESIKQVGLLDPIVLFEGKILDGRHRYKACKVVEVMPRFTDFAGDEEAALQFVLAKNIARRQLSTIQKLTLRDKLVPEIARLRAQGAANQEGGTLVSPETKVDTLGEVAQMVGVGRATAARFDAVKREAEAGNETADHFLDEMLAGNIGVKTAYEKMTSVTDELESLAKSDNTKSDVMKQKAALASAIGKAHALLINADPSILTSDYALAEQLFDLQAWVDDAYSYAR